MKWFQSKLTKPLRNTRGNILVSAFLTMVIMSLSVASLAQLTVNQYTTTKQKLAAVDQDMLGEALLEQSIYDFESYLNNNTFDFDGFMTSMTTAGVNDYGVLVEHVSGTSDQNGDYSDYDGLDNRAYRFTYTYNEGASTMLLYSFISNTGTYTESINPFDFQYATNGYLIQSSGYLRNPQIFGDTIVFTNVSPYINQNSGAHDKTPNTSSYPDFNGDGQQADVYYRTAYYYCDPDCYETSATASDPFVIQTSEFIDIESGSYTGETGNINEDRIIADFFGGFDLDDQIIDFVKNDGPTAAQTVTDSMSLSTIGTTIWTSNSGDPIEECVDTNPSPKKETWVCFDGPSTEPYTRLNTLTDFDPSTTDTEIGFGGIYQGNLTINHDFILTNLDATDTEAVIIDGDLTFNNSTDITIEAFFVVLGDLYFTGNEMSVGGGFYVTGETYIQMNEGEGFVDPSNSGGTDYSFALYGMDNILIESLYETHTSNGNETRFNWFVYTEESIYADVVNNRMLINGVFYAAAKGNSGNEIPMEDDLGNPIRGIVILGFNGYVRTNGNEVVVTNFDSFDFDPIQETNLLSNFLQLPEFETVLVQEGVFTMKRSEIFYNN